MLDVFAKISLLHIDRYDIQESIILEADAEGMPSSASPYTGSTYSCRFIGFEVAWGEESEHAREGAFDDDVDNRRVFMNLSYNNGYDSCFVRSLVTYNRYKVRIVGAPLEKGLSRGERIRWTRIRAEI